MTDRPRTTKVLLYLRVSTTKQAEAGHSLDTQRASCLAKLDELYGAGLYQWEEVIDRGVSGAYGLTKTGVANKVRPGLIECQKRLDTGEFDVFCCYKLDRLARTLRWLLQFLEDVLAPNEVRFLVATQNIDTDDISGKILLYILGLVAELERDHISARVTDGIHQRTAEGFPASHPGYGWDRAPADPSQGRNRPGIVPIPEQGEVVKRIAERYQAGGDSKTIAAEVNSRGTPSPSGKALWGFAAVLRVIGNPHHAGLIRHDGGLIQGQHHRLRFYDPETYYALQEERKRRKRWKTDYKPAKKHLLAGLISCVRCGRRLFVAQAHGAKYRYYRCAGELSPEGEPCRRTAVNADVMEDLILAQLREVCADEELMKLARAEAARLVSRDDEDLKREQKALRQRLAGLKGQFQRWAEMSTAGNLTSEQFFAFNEKLLEDQQTAQQRLAEIEDILEAGDQRQAELDRVLEALRDFNGLWAALSAEERRHLVEVLVESISIERVGEDMRVRIMLHLLGERVIRVPQLIRHRKANRAAGVDGLDPRQLALLKHWLDGKDRREIMELFDVAYQTVASIMFQIREHMGIRDLDEIARLAEPRIRETLPVLTLQGRVRLNRDRPVREVSRKLIDVLELGAQGLTMEATAQALGLRMSTIEGRWAMLREFFRAATKAPVIRKAREQGYLPDTPDEGSDEAR